jgi:SAM-dependent methyltransferase
LSGEPEIPDRVSGADAPEFSRIVRRFADDLARPSYRAQRRRHRALFARMRRRGLFVREDPARDWEHCHVALQLEATMAPGSKIVDFGGGGSILGYQMAASGYDVTVIDVDASICRAVNVNAGRLGLGAALRAIYHDGRSPWPLAGGDVDAIVSVSVFEALLRRQRTAFFAECRRVLRLHGELLITFDLGEGARLVGDPPRGIDDVMSEIVRPSGLALAGAIPSLPHFHADLPPPVRLAVPDVDGFDYVTAAYTFAALRFVKQDDPAPDAGVVPSAVPSVVPGLDAGLDAKSACEEVLRRMSASGRLRDMAPVTVAFEAWDAAGDQCWFWEISQTARQVDATRLCPDCVLAGTRRALGELLRRPEDFWALQSRGEFAPRGDLSTALRLVDAFPASA